MYDFLAFITRTQVAQDLPFGRSTFNFLLENFLKPAKCPQYRDSGRDCCSSCTFFCAKANVSAYGPNAFEINSYVLNSVFHSESVMADGEGKFGFALRRFPRFLHHIFIKR